MQCTNQRGQMENHGLEEYARFQLTNVLTLSFHLLPVNPFLTINANSAAHRPELCLYTQYYLPTQSTVSAYYGSNLLTSQTDGAWRKLKVSLLNRVSHSEPYSNALVSCPYGQLAGEGLGWERPEKFLFQLNTSSTFSSFAVKRSTRPQECTLSGTTNALTRLTR